MNFVVLIGRLTSDPKLTYTTSGTAVTSFRLAVNRESKDGGTDFIQCKAFGGQAENLPKYKSKGDELAVQGRIETGSYDKKDGTKVYTTEVICSRVEYTHGSKGGDRQDSFEPVAEKSRQADMGDLFDISDLPDTFSSAEDDIPF